jgi:hypothetical protein
MFHLILIRQTFRTVSVHLIDFSKLFDRLLALVLALLQERPDVDGVVGAGADVGTKRLQNQFPPM